MDIFHGFRLCLFTFRTQTWTLFESFMSLQHRRIEIGNGKFIGFFFYTFSLPFSSFVVSFCLLPLIMFPFFCFFAALPEEGPRITGGKPRYQMGDVVRVNCTSGRSKPAAHLNWFINGEPADPNFLRSYDSVITGREGLETSILGLEFRVKNRHFRRGDMKLKVSEVLKYSS